MKNSHYFLITLLFLLITPRAFSQLPEWFVLNNSGYLVNVRGADADEKGNLYVTGEYRGEMLFKSADSLGKTYHDYVSESLQKPFLAKYDDEGRLVFVSNLINRSGNSIYAVSVNTLSTGEIAWVTRASGQYSIIDTKGDEYSLRVRDQSVLILFSPDGAVISQTALPLDYCRNVLELDDNRLLLFGMGQRERNNELYVLDRITGKTGRIYSEMKTIYKVSLHEGRLWMLDLKQELSRMAPSKATIKLLSAETNDLSKIPFTHFEKHQEGFRSAGADLVKSGDSLKVVLRASLNTNGKLRFDDKEYSTDSVGMIFFLFDIAGREDGSIIMDTRQNGYYNTSVAGSSDGGYYIATPAMDYVKIQDQDTIHVAEHPQFINEWVLIHLNKNFQFEWLLPAGGTASNYHQSEIVPYKKSVYLISDLLDYGTFGGVYRELEWRAGFYIWQVNVE